MTISPRLSGLTWARGTTLTHAGPVAISWKVEGKELKVTYSVPPGIEAQFVPNSSHEGLTPVISVGQ